MDFEILNSLIAAISITPNLDEITTLPQFVKTVFDISISLVGLAVLIQFVRAGWRVLTAAGNTGKIGEANTMMTNAVVGAIILFSSVLLLNIINPDLTSLRFNDQAFSGGEIKSFDFDPVRNPAVRTNIKHQDAVDQLEKAGIVVKRGVSLEGVRQATIDYVIKLFNECKDRGLRGKIFGNCDGWSISRGTNFKTGSHTASQDLYESGFVLGLDADVDLEDYFEDTPEYFKYLGRIITGQRYRDKRNGAEFSSIFNGVDLTDWEVSIQ
jgi:hypothetical protein